MTHIINDMEIEKIKEKMCDDFCRYPRELECDLEEICEQCPLNNLEEGHDDL